MIFDVAVSSGDQEFLNPPEEQQSHKGMGQLVGEMHEPVQIVADLGRYKEQQEYGVCCESAK